MTRRRRRHLRPSTEARHVPSRAMTCPAGSIAGWLYCRSIGGSLANGPNSGGRVAWKSAPSQRPTTGPKRAPRATGLRTGVLLQGDGLGRRAPAPYAERPSTAVWALGEVLAPDAEPHATKMQCDDRVDVASGIVRPRFGEAGQRRWKQWLSEVLVYKWARHKQTSAEMADDLRVLVHPGTARTRPSEARAREWRTHCALRPDGPGRDLSCDVDGQRPRLTRSSAGRASL